VCAREDGIRRSKDLRAEIGKFPNSTNERKQMSKKTNFKRIALVAVASLGFGVFTSIAPANAAAVSDGDVTITGAVGTAVANIGICYTSGAEATIDKATITTAATLTFAVATSTGYLKIVSGPASFTGIGENNTATINAAADKITFTATTAVASLKASAVGTVKVASFTSSDAIVENFTITVVAKCGGDSLSLADSYYRTVAESTVTAGFVTTNVDDSGTTDVATKGYSYIAVDLKDAYGEALGTAGALIATATNGALVNINSDTAGSATTAVLATTAGSGTFIRVDTPTAGTPITTAVSVTFNGASVVTKTIKLRGYGRSIVVTDTTVGLSGQAYTGTSTAGAGTFKYQWKDANGDVVPGGAVAATAATGLTTLVTAVYGGASVGVGNTVAGAAASPTTTSGVTSYGDGKFTCTGSTKSGSATLAVAGNNANLDTVVSAAFTVTCGGALDTWTISTDKASYATGDIGTLTITGKDANGAMVTDIATLAGITGNVTIGGGAAFVSTPVSADTFTKGVKTYKFLVNNDEGSYGASVKITGATDTSAKTLQYKVASGTTTVSNADVLKSIVALIASINKQIQALQKLILKR